MSVLVQPDIAICQIATYAQREKMLPRGYTATQFARDISAANVNTFNAYYDEKVKPLRRFKRCEPGAALSCLVAMLGYNINWLAVEDDLPVAVMARIQLRMNEDGPPGLRKI